MTGTGDGKMRKRKSEERKNCYAAILGKTIKLARQGFTQGQIAGETGKSRGFINRLCKKFGIRTTGVLKREHQHDRKDITRQLELPFM